MYVSELSTEERRRRRRRRRHDSHVELGGMIET
jgi:hypothetical protein